jgi:cobyrinic acid a,c-diamide synthase
MRRDIQAFAATDGVIYAECGGLMYLCSALRTLDGIFHSMRDVLPGETRMCERLQALGYVEVQLVSDSILGRAGSCFRGHQFKYSNIDIQEQVVTKALRFSVRATANRFWRATRSTMSWAHTFGRIGPRIRISR